MQIVGTVYHVTIIADAPLITTTQLQKQWQQAEISRLAVNSAFQNGKARTMFQNNKTLCLEQEA